MASTTRNSRHLFSVLTSAVALATSLMFVSSPASASSPNEDSVPNPAPTANSFTVDTETAEDDSTPHEYVPSRLQGLQDSEETKEISAVALSFSGSTYGAAVMSYVADIRDLDSRRHGTSLVIDGVSESDIEDLEAAASHLGSFEGVEVFYEDEVSIAGVLSSPASNDPYKNTYAYDAIDLGDLWADIDNPDDEIVVAVLDTGVTEIADLAGRVLPGADFTDEEDGSWADEQGHGTFVASQIAGHFNNGTGSYGVCQQCKILPVQVLRSTGNGDFSMIAAGIRWAADNGADIISMSLGGESDGPLIAQDIEYAKSKGVILVAAAGNSGKNWGMPGVNKSYPAASEGVISVAASDPDGSGSFPRAGFSNYSKLTGGVDIAAPGLIDAAGLYGDTHMKGTSMATPIVSAVIGLMLAQFPDLTEDEITQRLFGFASANPLGYTVQGHIEGTSLLDESVSAPAPLTPLDFGVTVSGAWECTATEVGHLPVTLQNTGEVDASVDIVFNGFYWHEVTEYDTVLVPAGQTVSLSIDRSVFPGYIAEFYMYEEGQETGFIIWDYIPDHNDCAGFTVEHLDLAPHLCHLVPGQEELGIQRSTEVEYITSGNVHRIWIQSRYSDSSGNSATHSVGGANSQGEMWVVSGLGWKIGSRFLPDSGTIKLKIIPWFTEPFYSKSTGMYNSAALEVEVPFDNPCNDSYLPTETTIDSTVDWSTSSINGYFREYVDVTFDVPSDTEVEVLGMWSSGIYEESTYDWSKSYEPISSDGTASVYVHHASNGYKTTEDFSSLAAYRYRYRKNDGIAKSGWLESTVQFSVEQELSIVPEFLPCYVNWSQAQVDWYSPPTALKGTTLEVQVTTGSEDVSPDNWQPAKQNYFGIDSSMDNSRLVSNCVPDPDFIGEDVFFHVLRTETATTADGVFMGSDPEMFTFQVPTGISAPDGGGDDGGGEIIEEPITEEPIVEEPIVEEPITEEPITEEPITEEPITEEPITEEPITEEPITEEPIIEEPIVEEPIIEEPIVEEPINEEPDPEVPVDEPGKAELVDGHRVFNTRNTDAGYGLPAQSTRYVQIAGVGGVPVDATAATVNFTVAGAAGNGHLTAWSCDSVNSSVPDSSILNYDSDWVRANTQTIGLGANGGICVWSFADIDLLVDTQGYISSPSVHMNSKPARIADDRGESGRGDYRAGEVRRIEVAEDAVAAFVNLTVVHAKEWGFLTAWPCATEFDRVPDTSAANYDAGQTVANNSLVALNNGGFCVYSYGETGVIVDLMGIIGAGETSIVPVGSQRLVDTRSGAPTVDGRHAGGGAIEAGQTRVFQITGRGDVPISTATSNGDFAAVAGVYLNVTSVNADGPDGFLTVWACAHADETPPDTSALNYNDGWSATPNSIVQKVSATGRICVYAYQTTDVIIDVTGYVR